MQGGSTPGATRPARDAERTAWCEGDAPLATGEASDKPADDFVVRLTRTIEVDVIPRLVAAHRAQSREGASNDADSPVLGASAIDQFACEITAIDESAARRALDAHRSRGVSVEALYCDLLAPVARRLGEWWEDDRCDFATVTVGLGRLQRLMREMSPAFGAEVPHPVNGRRVLLARPPDEQHSFGLSMVGEFFRRAGWEAVSGDGALASDPVALVKREWFDIVGLSIGSDTRAGWAAGCIQAVRRASRNRRVAVLVGGPAIAAFPELVERLGADATASEARDVPALAESLVSSRVKMI